jgi:PKD repeat protein
MTVTKTVTTDGLYTVETYTGTGSYTGGWVKPANVTSIEVLVVAGGGGGGGTSGGGGGAGGVLNSTITAPATGAVITVGTGGAGGAIDTRGVKGGNSVFGTTLTAIGGGYGGCTRSTGACYVGGPGGSSGAAAGVASCTSGIPTSGQGYTGGNTVGVSGGSLGGSGGGGASQVGGSNSEDAIYPYIHGGNGGNGFTSSIINSASPQVYAGGGGGGDGILATSGLAPIASYTASVYSGVSPLYFTLTNTTTGTEPITYAWDYNNTGYIGSTDKTPTDNVYDSVGVHSCKMTATNEYGSSSVIHDFTVTNAGGLPVAAFTASPLTGSTLPLNVQFTDQSTSSTTITSWVWKWRVYGDSEEKEITFSTAQSPSCQFFSVANYNITLTVTDSMGSNTLTKIAYIVVTSSPTVPIASFTATPLTGTTPLTVTFTSTSNVLTGHTWTFGDGGTSTATNPSHVYASSGYYTVSLTVTNESGTDTETKTSYIYATTAVPITPVANFTANVTSGASPLIVQFTDTSTNSPSSWTWNFGDSTTSTLQSPSKTYSVIGTYTVTHTATNSAGTGSVTKTGYIVVTASTGRGAGTVLNGYNIGGSLAVTVDGYTFGGGPLQTPYYSAGVAGGTYTGSTVTTKAQLLDALTKASSPAVIYISPSANIDMGSAVGTIIPAGVTIASNRGQSGSRGGRIYSKTPGSGWGGRIFVTGGNNIKITGLVLEGEAYPENGGGNDATYISGIWVNGHTGFEVYNCELYGFAYADIYCASCPTSGRPWLHHNYVHGSQNTGEGYGYNVGGGDMLVEGNVFDRNRHDITGDGIVGERYTFRYNIILPTMLSITGQAHIDSHGGVADTGRSDGTSGARYDVYNNTVMGGQECCHHQRGYATEGTYVYNNIFNGNPGYNGFDTVIAQECDPTCGNMAAYVTNNEWNGVVYPTYIGIFWTH